METNGSSGDNVTILSETTDDKEEAVETNGEEEEDTANIGEDIVFAEQEDIGNVIEVIIDEVTAGATFCVEQVDTRASVVDGEV
jgi:hypothetical protein